MTTGSKNESVPHTLHISWESSRFPKPEDMMLRGRDTQLAWQQIFYFWLFYSQSHISRDEAKNKVPKRTPSPHTSPGTVSFVCSAFLLNSHITVKYFWSHSKQQLGIQAWFRIQSHVVFSMQMTQMGGKLMHRQRPPRARQSNENHKPLHTGLWLCLQAATFLLTLRTLLFVDCSKSSICAQQSWGNTPNISTLSWTERLQFPCKEKRRALISQFMEKFQGHFLKKSTNCNERKLNPIYQFINVYS